ncbi:hypothetical protein D3C84_791890 [compost metagenome]
MNAAGIGQDEIRASHQPDEMLVILGRYQIDVGFVREHTVNRLLHLWIEVHRVDELHVRVTFGERSQGETNVAETAAEVFPAMPGYQHHAPVVVEHRQR